jgi:hypothetical protein
MQRAANIGKLCRARKATAFFAGAVLASCLTLAAGCSTTHTAANNNNNIPGDPLLGPAPPPTVPSTTPGHAQNGLPPLTPNSGSATSAGLAGQSSLAISNSDSWARKVNDGTPPSTSGTVKTPAVPTKSPAVQEVPPDTSQPVTPIKPASWSSGSPSNASGPTPEELLASRGVKISHKDEVPGGVRVHCAVPDPANPDRTHYYQNDPKLPPPPDYATAVRDIVTQIDADRAKQ